MASSTASDARPGQPKINADLRDVAHQIHQEFADRLDPREVDECLNLVASTFDDAKIRSFVPLLVGRYARDKLRTRLGDASTQPRRRRATYAP